MERPPGRGAALHPSCRHKYLALQEQLLASPSTAGTRSCGEPISIRKREAPSALLGVTLGGRWWVENC